MNELSITFKNKKILSNFCKVEIHENLQELIYWFMETFGEPFITSAFRENGQGVHTVIPLRGLDLRSYIYTNADNVVDGINRAWIYDSSRPNLLCAIYHDVGQGAHIHLQVHDNTRKKD